MAETQMEFYEKILLLQEESRKKSIKREKNMMGEGKKSLQVDMTKVRENQKHLVILSICA